MSGTTLERVASLVANTGTAIKLDAIYTAFYPLQLQGTILSINMELFWTTNHSLRLLNWPKRILRPSFQMQKNRNEKNTMKRLYLLFVMRLLRRLLAKRYYALLYTTIFLSSLLNGRSFIHSLMLSIIKQETVSGKAIKRQLTA